MSGKKSPQTVLKRPTPPVLLALAFSGVMLITAFLLAVVGERLHAQRRLHHAVAAWQADLSAASAAGDYLLIRKIGRNMMSEELKEFEININDVTVFSKSNRVDPKPCFNSVEAPIVRYGVNLGTVNACLDTVVICRNVVASPALVALAVALAIVASMAGIYPLARYRKAMYKSVKILNTWAHTDNAMLPNMAHQDKILEALIGLVKGGVERERSAERSIQRTQRLEDLVQVTAHVSHDIMSPLAALDVVVRELAALPEDIRLLVRSSVGRIRDIANQLLAHNALLRVESGAPPVCDASRAVLLSALVNNVVSEKRLRFRGLVDIHIHAVFDSSSYGLFSDLVISDMKRCLSNCIDNSVEAMAESGTVTISVAEAERMAVLSIVDDGPGIPHHIIPTLGTRGVTYQKKGGRGLGLHYARQTAEKSGGSLTISSPTRGGTRIDIRLPLIPPPDWFTSAIVLSPGQQVIVVDDDQAIHHVWHRRFMAQGVPVLHFTSLDKFEQYCDAHREKSRDWACLIDYEFLQTPRTGLDFIEDGKLDSRCILVTSHYEQTPIQMRCLKRGVGVLPKELASVIPIRCHDHSVPHSQKLTASDPDAQPKESLT